MHVYMYIYVVPNKGTQEWADWPEYKPTVLYNCVNAAVFLYYI